MSKELKACPFCGSEETEIDRKNIEIRHIAGRDYWIIMCRCGINSGEYANRETAISHWNNRPRDRRLDKEKLRIIAGYWVAH